MRSSIAACGALFAALFLGACGSGDDGPTAEEEAKAAKAVVRQDETQAEVTLSLKGASLDGTTGEIEMVKEGTWRVDDYADDFVRSAFLAAIRTTDEGAVSTPGMKACFSHQVQQLPAAEIRRLT